MPRLKREGSERNAPPQGRPECPRIGMKSAVNEKPSGAQEANFDPLEAPEKAPSAACSKQGGSREKSGWRRHHAPRFKRAGSRGLADLAEVSNCERTERTPVTGREKRHE